jgi:hypothetical protein
MNREWEADLIFILFQMSIDRKNSLRISQLCRIEALYSDSS